MSDETWRYFLTVESRPLELTDGEATFGRSRTSTVRLDHESVSRSHALLTLHRGDVTIRDLNSSNGTWIGGKRISGEVRLADGSRVQLGAAVIELKIVPPAVPSERTALLDSSKGPPIPAEPPSAVPASGAPPAPITYQPEAVVSEAAPAADLAPPAGPKPITASGLFADIDRQVREAGVDHPVHEEELPCSADAAATVVPAGPSSVAEVSLAIGPSIAAKAEVREAPDDRHAAPDGPEPQNAAGLAARFAALLVDGVILVAMDLLLFSPLLVIAYFRPALQPALPSLNDPVFSGILGLCVVLAFAANVLYTAGLWAMRGRTPGKALLGLAIVRRGANPGVGIGWNAAIVRWIFQILGAVPVGLGWWTALFRKDRRAWHDVVAGTWVVRAR